MGPLCLGTEPHAHHTAPSTQLLAMPAFRHHAPARHPLCLPFDGLSVRADALHRGLARRWPTLPGVYPQGVYRVGFTADINEDFST